MSTSIPRSTAAEKQRIGGAFDRVAARYDLMCALNPGYRRHLRLSAKRLDCAPGARILDLCCGTGLSTREVVDTYPDAEVVGIDLSPGMLEHARRKLHLGKVTFVEGDAMDPAACGVQGPFNGILMAYGLRNVPDPDMCLARLRGLLAPGGTLCVHEYSVADSAKSRAIWNLVSFAIVIPLALVVTGSTKIFRYLRRSVLEFDGVKRLEERLRQSGYTDVETMPMDGWQRGITHTFRAREPRP